MHQQCQFIYRFSVSGWSFFLANPIYDLKFVSFLECDTVQMRWKFCTRKGRNVRADVHNRSVFKEHAAKQQRRRFIVGYIHKFQGFYFSCSTVSSSVTSMHFQSCDVWPTVGKGLIRGALWFLFYFSFVAFTSQGEILSSYREILSPFQGVFYFCKPKWFLLSSLIFTLHLFSPMCYLIVVKCAK